VREKHTSVNQLAYKSEGKGAADESIKPSAHYEELAASYEARASEQDSHKSDKVTLVTQFGDILNSKLTSVGKLDAKSDIVWYWDKNGDGKISQQEWRVQVKGLGLTDANIHDVDGLFKKWDKDGNGFLDLAELKVFFKHAMVKANEVAGGSKEIVERAARLRQLAAQAKEVAERTAELEAEQALLDQMRTAKGMTLEEKLGQALAKRNTHVSDLVQGWDDSNDGLVDKEEFRAHVRSVGITEIQDAALDELYDSVDKDKNGSLDLKEIKETLKRLQLAATRSVGDVNDEVGLVTEMQRIVKKLQAKFNAAKAADDKEQAETAAVDVQ